MLTRERLTALVEGVDTGRREMDTWPAETALLCDACTRIEPDVYTATQVWKFRLEIARFCRVDGDLLNGAKTHTVNSIHDELYGDIERRLHQIRINLKYDTREGTDNQLKDLERILQL